MLIGKNCRYRPIRHCSLFQPRVSSFLSFNQDGTCTKFWGCVIRGLTATALRPHPSFGAFPNFLVDGISRVEALGIPLVWIQPRGADSTNGLKNSELHDDKLFSDVDKPPKSYRCRVHWNQQLTTPVLHKATCIQPLYKPCYIIFVVNNISYLE